MHGVEQVMPLQNAPAGCYPRSTGVCARLAIVAEQPAASARLGLRVTNMDDSLTGQIRGWFGRSPKAQRAVERLRADLDSVAGWVERSTRGELRDSIADRIDPPSGAPTPAQDTNAAAPEPSSAETPSTATDSAASGEPPSPPPPSSGPGG
jgi:hypothetical protein